MRTDINEYAPSAIATDDIIIITKNPTTPITILGIAVAGFLSERFQFQQGAEEASLKGASAFVDKHRDDGMLDNLYVHAQALYCILACVIVIGKSGFLRAQSNRLDARLSADCFYTVLHKRTRFVRTRRLYEQYYQK